METLFVVGFVAIWAGPAVVFALVTNWKADGPRPAQPDPSDTWEV